MSMKSALATTCAIGAVLLAVGCGGGGGGNASPTIKVPHIIWDITASATLDLTDPLIIEDRETPNADLTYSLVDQPSALGTNWGVVSAVDAEGVLTDPASITYADGTSTDGMEYFRFSVSDGTVSTTGIVWIVTTVNDGPTGADWGVAVTEDDPPLSITLDGDTTPVQDPEGDPLVYTIVDLPDNGTLTYSSLSGTPLTDGVPLRATAPTVTYKPDPNWPYITAGSTEEDTFTFSVSDMSGTPVEYTVTVTGTAVNDAPVITTGLSRNVDAGAVAIVVLSADDADNDTLTFAITSTGTIPATASFTDRNDTDTIASHVNILSQTLAYTVADDGGVLYFRTPPNVWGDYDFTFTVTDGTETVTGNVSIDVGPPEQHCWSWGFNNGGQLGLGDGKVNDTDPVRAKGWVGGTSADEWELASGGRFHSVLKTATGSPSVCGDNGLGQIGAGASIRKGTPTQISGFANATWVAAGKDHTVVAQTDGKIKTSGLNDRGQLGDGSMVTRFLPVEVKFRNALAPGSTSENDIDPAALSSDPDTFSFVMVAAGNQHTLILDSEGDVWVCGDDTFGQLGRGAGLDEQIYAVKIPPGEFLNNDIVFIAAGGDHSMAIDEFGNLWSWGEYDTGQLGRAHGGNTYRYPYTVGVTGTVNWAACGQRHSLATNTAGDLYVWGSNGHGQLGMGELAVGSVSWGPSQVTTLYTYDVSSEEFSVATGPFTFVEAAAGGGHHSIVRTAADPAGVNSVFACGLNDYGQVGVPEIEDFRVPVWVKLDFNNDILGLGAGWYHTFAIQQGWQDP